jgi:hypothetical protein
MVVQVLTCVLRLYAANGDAQSYPVRCFDFDVPPEVVAEYLYVEPEPEVAVPPPTARAPSPVQQTPPTPVVVTSVPTPVRRDPKEIAETFIRLTKLTRMPTIGMTH